MKIFSRLTCVLCSVVLILPMFSRPARASSQICANCAAAIVGTAIGVAAGVVVGIYFIHRSRTSLTGCIQETGNGLSLIAKNGDKYALVNAPDGVTPHRRFSLRGHRVKVTSGRGFRVDRLARDYGMCTP